MDLENEFYSSDGGVLFTKDKGVIIQFPGGKTGEYTIPDSVTRIEDGAFSGCAELTSITMSARIYRIGDAAFSGCTSLASVTFSRGHLGIGDGAFSSCTSLTSITIPANAFLGAGAFSSCNNLTSVLIGENAFLDVGVFWLCSNLSNVRFTGNAPIHLGGSDTFYSSFPTVYRRYDTTGWSDTFLGRPVRLWPEIMEISASLTGITFQIVASTNQLFVVEAATSLLANDWTPVYAGVVTEGESFEYSDPDVDLHPQRFYRIVIE